ncbi:DUF429 domain-containing protein [Aciduricibacillus chroicocephali]|uniref:DUF429 domain-containing protein n=1 Tax=Aciduricibacillus chroicocephali TaxID=3054939 RepID=A0ABY9KYC5_9BACI|nr:DUF429 domain-containing protein [Bacillaceae bacterium 44XB]
MKAVGIDGCKDGWVGVVLWSEGYSIERTETLGELLEPHKDAEIILIDMPIGLPETKEEDLLRPEKLARQHLGKRSCTVFNVPCRQAIGETEYEQANRINRQVLGKGLSKQSFYIANKIRELDEFLKLNSFYRNRLLESHPELLFKVLSKNNMPLTLSKKTAEGFTERLQIIRRFEKRIDLIALQIAERKELQKIRDDVLDAYVLAVAGRLGLSSGFITIPDMPSHDASGLRMQMTVPYMFK